MCVIIAWLVTAFNSQPPYVFCMQNEINIMPDQKIQKAMKTELADPYSSKKLERLYRKMNPNCTYNTLSTTCSHVFKMTF